MKSVARPALTTFPLLNWGRKGGLALQAGLLPRVTLWEEEEVRESWGINRPLSTSLVT
jgi:hypothetical protein